MQYIVDRFEGDKVVIENAAGDIFVLPRQLLPSGAGEGAVIEITHNTEAESRRRDEVRKLMDQVWED